jgi:hypothetical protein
LIGGAEQRQIVIVEYEAIRKVSAETAPKAARVANGR